MITVNHEFAKEIMDYLSEYEDIKGDEDHLIGEKLIYTTGDIGIYNLEKHFNILYEADFNFKNLIFIKL